MTRLSRRNFLKGVGALPLALGLPRSARATELMVRHDVASEQGQQMLAIFAAAVRRMQAYRPDSPMGWLWQWYTHFVDGNTTKSAEIDRIFGTTNTANRRLAVDTWDTCQSHSGEDPNNFLPWHRMFVFYLERMVRRVSGRDDFTLPYWDYTSDDPAKRGVVPAQFRMPDDPVFGPLYRADRSELANSGEPIQKDQPGDPMRIGGPMSKQNYELVGSDVGFCRAINSGIHGSIHVLVGTRTGMGSVPFAGNDPLFWVHHSNIDRIWESWNRNGGINPVDAEWARKTFVFADAYGRASAPMNDFFDCDALGYGYDAYIPPPGTSTTSTSTLSAKRSARPERVAQARTAAELGAGPVHVKLLPVAGTPTDAAVLGLEPRQTGKRVYLVLKGLHAWSQPEVLYHVYLSPTRGGRLDDASYAGHINFFDAEFHDHGNGAMADVLAQNLYGFDVTGLLQGIARSGNPDAREALLVTFVPGGVPTPGGKPMVGTIELVRE
jgi:tyrosinase